MPYHCRDCKHSFTPDKPTNRCPACGSIYLLPEGFQVTQQPRTTRIHLSERFLSLILGFISGLITFFMWGIVLLLKGGPGTAKAALGATYLGLKLSVSLAVIIGMIGFFIGEKRLAKLLGVLWGTDKEFNDKFGAGIYSIPLWIVYPLLILAIIGSYGYLAIQL